MPEVINFDRVKSNRENLLRGRLCKKPEKVYPERRFGWLTQSTVNKDMLKLSDGHMVSQDKTTDYTENSLLDLDILVEGKDDGSISEVREVLRDENGSAVYYRRSGIVDNDYLKVVVTYKNNEAKGKFYINGKEYVKQEWADLVCKSGNGCRFHERICFDGLLHFTEPFAFIK